MPANLPFLRPLLLSRLASWPQEASCQVKSSLVLGSLFSQRPPQVVPWRLLGQMVLCHGSRPGLPRTLGRNLGPSPQTPEALHFLRGCNTLDGSTSPSSVGGVVAC